MQTADHEPASVELPEADILGAALDELLDVYKVAALRWWLHAVPWNQACTFVEKATLNFKVGSFSIVHIKLLACLWATSTNNAYIPRHSNNRYRTTAASSAVVSVVELSNGTSHHQIFFATLLLKNCFILYIRFIGLNGSTGQHAQLKLSNICINSNGEVRCK